MQVGDAVVYGLNDAHHGSDGIGPCTRTSLGSGAQSFSKQDANLDTLTILMLIIVNKQ